MRVRPIPADLRLRLRTAVREESVVAVVNEFLTAIPVSQLSTLPSGSVPARVDGCDDLGYWALRLAHTDLDYRGSQASADLLREIAQFLADAANRIARIREWNQRR